MKNLRIYFENANHQPGGYLELLVMRDSTVYYEGDGVSLFKLYLLQLWKFATIEIFYNVRNFMGSAAIKKEAC